MAMQTSFIKLESVLMDRCRTVLWRQGIAKKSTVTDTASKHLSYFSFSERISLYLHLLTVLIEQNIAVGYYKKIE